MQPASTGLKPHLFQPPSLFNPGFSKKRPVLLTAKQDISATVGLSPQSHRFSVSQRSIERKVCVMSWKIWGKASGQVIRLGEDVQGIGKDVLRSQRITRENGKSLYYKPYITWVFMGKLSPRIPREHNKYHGYTVRGTPNYPLRCWFGKPESYKIWTILSIQIGLS